MADLREWGILGMCALPPGAEGAQALGLDFWGEGRGGIGYEWKWGGVRHDLFFNIAF